MTTISTYTENSSRNVHAQERKATPLPKFQIFILYLIQFAEPVTALVIYPFINQFVRDTGITNGDEMKTGHYAGVIESIFFLAECLTVVQWGYLSDRYGRRPVLLIGPLGLSIAMLFFGLSTSFWPLVVLRCLQGSFNGNIGVAKTVIAEITDETNIADAYSYTSAMWHTGSTIAPTIGGVLSQPAERWPDTFGRIAFFQRYPYFLPCAAAAFLAFLSYAIALFGLKETLPSLLAEREMDDMHDDADAETPLLHHEDNVSYGTTPSVTTLVEAPSCSTNDNRNSFHMLTHRPLMLIFLNYIVFTFLDMANAALLPLMFSTPLEYGGLGLTPFYIGTALGCFGIVNAIFQVKFQGKFMRNFGKRRLYQVGIISLIVPFSTFPIMKYFAQRAGGVDALVWGWIAIHLAARAGGSMAYGAMQVLIVQSVPEGGLLGTANGFGQMLASGMRAIAPSFVSSLFSISLQRNLAGGNLVYYVLLGLTILSVQLSLFVVEPQKRKGST